MYGTGTLYRLNSSGVHSHEVLILLHAALLDVNGSGTYGSSTIRESNKTMFQRKLEAGSVTTKVFVCYKDVVLFLQRGS